MADRLLFSKTGRAKYISHLDLMRTFQRAFARAHIQIKHTEGFNPHPFVSIALPLSVGYSSQCEILEFGLMGDMPYDQVPELLTAVNTPTPSASVVDLKYSKNDATGEEKTTAVVEIILNLPKEQDLRDLIIGSYPLDNGSFANSKLAATMDNGQTLLPLVYDNGDARQK